MWRVWTVTSGIQLQKACVRVVDAPRKKVTTPVRARASRNVGGNEGLSINFVLVQVFVKKP